jgi:hypothetical protein
MFSYWERNDLGVSEIYISLLENKWYVDLEIDGIRFAAPYAVMDGNYKYQAVDVGYPLFCGDAVHLHGKKYIFLCAAKPQHENDATLCFLIEDAIKADAFECKPPQTFDRTSYLEIKVSDFKETSFTPVERYELNDYDLTYERLAKLLVEMMEYDCNLHQDPTHIKERVPEPEVQQERAISSPIGK